MECSAAGFCVSRFCVTIASALTAVAVAFSGVVLIGAWKSLQGVEKRQERVDVTLFGEKGTGGHAGRIKELEEQLNRIPPLVQAEIRVLRDELKKDFREALHDLRERDK